MKTKHAIITAVVLAALSVGIVFGINAAFGTTYPHKWCYKAETLMNSRTPMTAVQYENRLAAIHAPLPSKLSNDSAWYHVQKAYMENGSILDFNQNMRNTVQALGKVSRDLRAIDTACHVSVKRAGKQNA